MPFVSINGQLIEVTQAQYDAYTAPTIASSQTVPAGGTVTVSATSTAEILTPNTTNTSPGQTLVTTAETPNFSATGGTTTGYGEQNDLPEDITDTQTDPADGALAGYGQTDPGDGALAVSATDINTSATAVALGPAVNAAYDDDGNLLPGYQLDEENNPIYTGDTNTSTIYYPDGTSASASSEAAVSNIQGLVKNAQQQNTIAAQRRQINNGDWRVRLRLAPQANYLYKAPKPGILQPLAVTDGVIFPYTPAITTSYRANYSNYDLTHSNYRGYFYQNSYVDAINLTAMFTAQDTNDANYLLSVIHFFRSATKMFYGKDTQRGSPPPVVFLTGLGEYQFNEHPCLINQFNYNLPADVDYIRAGSPNNSGLDFNNIRDRQSVATNSIFGSINRLAAAFLTKGAINQGTSIAAPPTLGLNRPTYVPTKMEITLSLLPIQSRQQVSKQFSLEGFANGSLLKGGFW